jgi:hypothetical protein
MNEVKHSGWAAGEPSTRFDRAIAVIGVLVVAGLGIFIAAINGLDAFKVLGGVLAALLFVAIYFVPTIIAALGKHPLVAPVLVLNVFLGWTFVGWVVALALAVWPMNTNTIRGK